MYSVLSLVSVFAPLINHLCWMESIGSGNVLTYEVSSPGQLDVLASYDRYSAYNIRVGDNIVIVSDGAWERSSITDSFGNVTTSFDRAKRYRGNVAFSPFVGLRDWKLKWVGIGAFAIETASQAFQLLFDGLRLKEVRGGNTIQTVNFYGVRNEIPGEFMVRRRIREDG